MSDTGDFSVTVIYRKDLDIFGKNNSGVTIEVWRDKDGNFARPLDLPAITVYDYDNFSKLYEAWPDPDGSFSPNEFTHPVEIYYDPENPRMVWYDDKGQVKVTQKIDPSARQLTSNEVRWMARDSGYDSSITLRGSDDYNDPTEAELKAPNSVMLALDR
ncbi:hypothetical protein [Litorimonas sp.]|uniref:hypothetical protein n=1 Tax=Litorimonas sp. TaxID=1892381 RepID=UPI003A88E302